MYHLQLNSKIPVPRQVKHKLFELSIRRSQRNLGIVLSCRYGGTAQFDCRAVVLRAQPPFPSSKSIFRVCFFFFDVGRYNKTHMNFSSGHSGFCFSFTLHVLRGKGSRGSKTDCFSAWCAVSLSASYRYWKHRPSCSKSRERFSIRYINNK